MLEMKQEPDWRVQFEKKKAEIAVELKANPARSDRAIAVAVNTSKASVYRIRGELEAAKVIPVIPSHERMRITGDYNAPKLKSPNELAGPRIRIPEGQTIIDVINVGLRFEKEGKTPQEAAHIVGIGIASYREAKAIILLSQRNDLTAAEKEATTKALALITKERRTREAHTLVKELSVRVWGSGKNSHSEETAQRIIENFMNAVSVIMVACDKGKDLTIPQLGAADAADVILQLKEAAQSLKKLRSNLNRRIR